MHIPIHISFLYIAGKLKVTFVTDFLKVEYLRKHGLAAILEGYCYQDIKDRDRETLKPLISYVFNANKQLAKFKDAFSNYLYPKGKLLFSFLLCTLI